MNRIRVTVSWGCHPEFRCYFDVTPDSYGDGATHPSGPVPETALRAVYRVKADGSLDLTLIPVESFLRVIGPEAAEDLCDAALEAAEDAAAAHAGETP